MRFITLEAFRDDNTGEVGLGLLRMRRDETTNAAMEGLLIAHDLIEHVNGVDAIGTIDDELEALGAIWYVRGQHGDLQRGRPSMYSVAENISADITRMFRDHLYGQYSSCASPRSRACEIDESLQETMCAADVGYLSEIDYEDRDKARAEWPQYRAGALYRMRLGFRKARRTWERRGRYAANTQFWAITEAIDDTVRHRELFEGQRFQLRYGKGEAYCTELEDYS